MAKQKQINTHALVTRQQRPPRWTIHSRHASGDAAWDVYKKSVQGRGVTAWAAVVPVARAEAMVADPSLSPEEGGG